MKSRTVRWGWIFVAAAGASACVFSVREAASPVEPVPVRIPGPGFYNSASAYPPYSDRFVEAEQDPYHGSLFVKLAAHSRHQLEYRTIPVQIEDR